MTTVRIKALEVRDRVARTVAEHRSHCLDHAEEVFEVQTTVENQIRDPDGLLTPRCAMCESIARDRSPNLNPREAFSGLIFNNARRNASPCGCPFHLARHRHLRGGDRKAGMYMTIRRRGFVFIWLTRRTIRYPHARGDTSAHASSLGR